MRKGLWIVCSLLVVHLANAQDFGFSASITQEEFKAFAREMGTALWFSPGAPAESLGITGFDISADVVLTDMSNGETFWQHMTLGDPDSTLMATRIHAQKGLPFGVDVGMMWTDFRDTNGGAWGVEAKYAILEGSTVMPAVTVRGSYSRLTGVDDFDMSTMGVDLMVSKGFLMVTPYGGISLARIKASPNVDGFGLHGVTETVTQVYGGVQISPMPFLVINGEVVSGEVMQYSLKAGIRF